MAHCHTMRPYLEKAVHQEKCVSIGTDDREQLKSSIATVLSAQCPIAKVHRHIDGTEDLTAFLRRSAADLGWLALSLPEAHGGLGLDVEGLALLSEEMGRRLAP